MRIILSNDDGIQSNGLVELAKCLSKKHELLIVAPEDNRSASSHSMTVGKPIKINKVNFFDNIVSYSISGTPVDCVKIAKLMFKDFKSDLVVAGINKGHNLGSDTLYSGTLSIACEASFFGDVAFAFSCFGLGESDFINYSLLAEEIIEKLYPVSNKGDIFNVNFPNCNRKEINGIKMTSLGKQLYTDRYEKVSDDTYKLVGELISHNENSLDCDVEWIKKGFVTVTPILYNKTDYNRLKKQNVF